MSAHTPMIYLSAVPAATARTFKSIRASAAAILLLLGFSFTLTTSAQTITTGAVSSPINTGSTFNVPMTATGSYLMVTSVFSAYISDATGSFATKTLIGSYTYWGTVPASISCTMPCGISAGSLYRIRVECNNPFVVGTDNGSNLTVNAGPSIVTGTVSTPFCQGATVNVPYTVLCGPLSAGNVFTAELSTSSGTFPGTAIGSLTSTSSGTITATIPLGTAPSSLYRIRVTSTNPLLTGTSNSNGSLTLNTISITTGAVSSSFCQGNVISVPYTVCGGFTSGNIFTAQLSDASGNFTGGEVNIGSLSSISSGSISATVPLGTVPGSLYRIRVISSVPSVTGSLNSNGALTVNAISITTGSISSSFCQGATVSVPYTVCGGFISGNVFTAQLSDPSGNFNGSEINIGTLTTTSSSTITAVIPLSCVPASTYRIRVISSTPSVTGSINSNGNLTLNPISVTVGALSSGLCQGNMISIPYTICGGYNSGNVFTAQLSNASGSFASPLNIGSTTSVNGGYITANIPSTQPTGNGYRIRIVSSNPAVTGADNGTNISIDALTTLPQYTYTQGGTSYSALSGNTDVPVVSGTLDDGLSGVINIGFTFNFGGINFTQFVMNTNGYITFNLSSTATTVYNAISSSETYVIAGFSANIKLSGTKPMSYVLTGTAPNRILKLQWQNITHTPLAPGTGTLTAGAFQIWLYETTNVFKIMYGTWTATSGANFGSYAQVGWKGKCPTDGEALYKNSYPYWDTPWSGYGYMGSLSFGSSNGFIFLPTPGEMFTYTPPLSLPIELVSFSGLFADGKNLLQWSTASEVNNSYYEVERSSDGNEFITIGKVNGAGNSESANEYSFTDEAPLPGNNYYRLKQTDYSGAFTYSEVIVVQSGSRQLSCNVYPNPASTQINCDVALQEAGMVTLEIADQYGRILITQQNNAAPGILRVAFQTKTWSSGIYFLHIRASGKELTMKFSKQ